MHGRLCGIEPAADVRDYLVTDADLVKTWEGPDARAADEKLLLVEDDDGLAIALYLEPEVLSRLDVADPLNSLSPDCLADFCKVVEGISHFNYVVFSAARERRVTQLELEMQAEVDKYVSARTLIHQSPESRAGVNLWQLLFADPVFSTDLSSAERERYKTAWDLGASYCRSLEARYAEGVPDRSMLRELRRFFRLPQPDKVSHINAMNFA